ncbi:UNVERIFIED_CONTAM: hypothetical protein Sradi_6907500 [Sesamum radiatum]|uniref:Uncharacterized protein n=1 Tax=Sesamum radiatum TaxID=300843 RepID=A0AAW2JIF2_SESRA
MEIPNNTANNQKAEDTSRNTQTLQVIIGMLPATAAGGSTPATLTQTPPPPKLVGLTVDPPHRSTFPGTYTEQLSPALLGVIQQIISAAIREPVATLAPVRVATPSDVDAPKEEAKGNIPVPLPPADRRQGAPPLLPQDIPL